MVIKCLTSLVIMLMDQVFVIQQYSSQRDYPPLMKQRIRHRVSQKCPNTFDAHNHYSTQLSLPTNDYTPITKKNNDYSIFFFSSL